MSEAEIIGWRVRVRRADGSEPDRWVHEPGKLLATERSSSHRFDRLARALAEANYWTDSEVYAYPVPIRRRRPVEAKVTLLCGYGPGILVAGLGLRAGDTVAIRKVLPVR